MRFIPYLFSKVLNNNTNIKRYNCLDDFYSCIINNSDDAIAFYNCKGEIFHKNKSLDNFINQLEKPILAKNINQLLDLFKSLDITFPDVYKGKNFDSIQSLKTKDKTKHYIIKLSPIFSKEEIIGGYLIIIDISNAIKSSEDQNTRLRKLINTAGIGIVICDHNHRVIDTNVRFAEMLGYSIEEMYDLHIWDWDANMKEEDVRKSYENFAGLDMVFETRHRRKDGSIYDVEISAYAACLNEEDRTSASICLCQDISQRKQMEKQLIINERRYRNLVENTSEIILVLKEDSTIDYVSPNCLHIIGYSQDEMQNKKMYDFLVKKEDDPIKVILQQQDNSKINNTQDVILKHKDESEHWYNINNASSYDNEGICNLICYARNIDERKEYEKKLQYLSTHDQLTGIYNRRLFDIYKEHQAKKREYPLSLLVCDIDNLKHINDTYGHAQGDRIIKLCANAIQYSLRKCDFLARTGGDEFYAILPCANEKEAQKIIDRIKNSIMEVRKKEEIIQYNLSISIGSATAHNEECSFDQLLSKADSDMYNQKKIT